MSWTRFGRWFLWRVWIAPALWYLYYAYVNTSLSNFTVDESFFEPALSVARNYSRHRRDVLGLSDEQFLRLGIERVLGHCDSGRDFLQARQDRGEALAREKVYDVYKNKLHQQKAWANGSVAGHTQAHLIALTHNLLTLLLSSLESAGCAEDKVIRHQAARRQQQAEHQRVPAHEMVRHATQLTCQFIRLVRHCLRAQTPWRIALPLFQSRLAGYL